MHSPADPVACSGFSRRSFFRYAAGASALASMPILTEAHLAFAAAAPFRRPQYRASTLMPTRTRWGPPTAHARP